MLNTDVFSQNPCQIRFDGCSTSPTKKWKNLKVCLHLRANLKFWKEGERERSMYVHTQGYHFFFNKLNTHTVVSMKSYQFSSSRAYQPNPTGVIGRISFVTIWEGFERRGGCPSFNCATIPKQRPHQFILITPRCCMGSTYRQFIYHKSQLTSYVPEMQACSGSTRSMTRLR